MARVSALEEAFVSPFVADPSRRVFSGAAYHASGRLCRNSQRTTSPLNEWQPINPEILLSFEGGKRIRGKSLYLGHYTGHYGHFLLESLSRLWALGNRSLTEAGYDRVVFHPFLHKTPRVRTFSPAKISFACYGISEDRLLLINQPTVFEHLTVPEPLLEINHRVDPTLADVYENIAQYCLSLNSSRPDLICRLSGWSDSGPLKLYVSRRRARGYHPMINEPAVESMFRDLGFKILHPERWRFEQQIALFRRADVLAGVEGSALHNSVFMRAGTRVISIGTPREPSGDILNQRLCNSLSGVSSTSIPFVGQVVGGVKARYDVEFVRSQLKPLLLS